MLPRALSGSAQAGRCAIQNGTLRSDRALQQLAQWRELRGSGEPGGQTRRIGSVSLQVGTDLFAQLERDGQGIEFPAFDIGAALQLLEGVSLIFDAGGRQRRFGMAAQGLAGPLHARAGSLERGFGNPAPQAACRDLALAVPRDAIEEQRPFELGCGLLFLALGGHGSVLTAALRIRPRMVGLGGICSVVLAHRPETRAYSTDPRADAGAFQGSHSKAEHADTGRRRASSGYSAPVGFVLCGTHARARRGKRRATRDGPAGASREMARAVARVRGSLRQFLDQ